MVRRILSDPADAEEVCLDVYTQAWRVAGRYDQQRGSVMAWLLTMAKSRALDRWRRSAARGPAVEVHSEGPTQSAPTWHTRCSPLDALLAAEQARRVHQAVARLEAGEREFICQAFFEGWTHCELAERQRVPVGTVKTRIRTGLRKLRSDLSAPERHPADGHAATPGGDAGGGRGRSL